MNRYPLAVRQMISKTLALYSDEDGRKRLFLLYDAVQLIRFNGGEEILKSHYGESYNKIKNKLDSFNEKIYGEDKEDLFDELPLVHTLIYEVFGVLATQTEIKNMLIQSRDFMRWRRYIPVRYQDKVKQWRNEKEASSGREDTQNLQSEKATQYY